MTLRPSSLMLALAIPLSLSVGPLHSPATHEQFGPRPPASFAILARDPITGEYGVAAASHAPLIGMNLEFLDLDAGGVVVLGGPYLQVNENALIALRNGLTPAQAISVGLANDPDKENRQVLAVAPGGSAAFTGKKLQGHADDVVGDYFVAAGHRLAGGDVLAAMADSFTASDGPLTKRLLAALVAANGAGGEKDGVHSAALVVVGPGARFATRNRLTDLRIDFVSGDAVQALAAMHAQVDSIYEVVR